MEHQREPSQVLKVLILAPIALPISPQLKYAGTERVIYNTTKQLSKYPNIQTTLVASGDSELDTKKVEIIYTEKNAVWSIKETERKIIDFTDKEDKHIDFCIDFALKNKIDIIHAHLNLADHEVYRKRESEITMPIIVTIHNHVNPELKEHYQEWKKYADQKKIYYVAISDAHKEKFEKDAGLPITEVVYNGIDIEKIPFVGREEKQTYLLWLGRINKMKGVDLAVKVAKAGKYALIIAGEIHTPDRSYFDDEIRPHITKFIDGATFEEQEENRNKIIDRLAKGEKILGEQEIFYIGPVDDKQKAILNGHAFAFLMLNRWEEPFGLTMIEAMATGTPVIGTQRGSIPEIVKNKITGYILPVKWINKETMAVDEEYVVKKALKKLEEIPKLNPMDCRKHVEEYFTAEVMTKKYIDLYQKILEKQKTI